MTERNVSTKTRIAAPKPATHPKARPGISGAPQIELIKRSDIEAAIAASRTGGVNARVLVDEHDLGGMESPEARNRVLVLERLLDDPRRTRPALIADAATVARVDALRRAAPNMERPLTLVRDLCTLSRTTCRPLRLPPIVLLGPPGTGKTWIAARLAKEIANGGLTLQGTSMSDDHWLLGTPYNWKSCGMGGIARALLAGPTARPTIIIDEAEKTGSYDKRDCPLDCLLPLLEPATAVTARDKYLDVPMVCTNISWVFCCNTLDGLSLPFLDRCTVMDVPDLAPDERVAVVEAILDELLDENGLEPSQGRAGAVTALAARHGLRRARTLLHVALAGAVSDGRWLPDADDVRAAVALLGGRSDTTRRQPVGFHHHR